MGTPEKFRSSLSIVVEQHGSVDRPVHKCAKGTQTGDNSYFTTELALNVLQRCRDRHREGPDQYSLRLKPQLYSQMQPVRPQKSAGLLGSLSTPTHAASHLAYLHPFQTLGM